MTTILSNTLIKSFLLLTPLFGLSQTACVTFESIDASFNAASNQIIHTESGISLRFIDGFLGPSFSDITINELPAWTGSFGNDNFSGNKIHWTYASTNVLFDELPNGFKTITFDYNSYGEKIIMEDIQVWSQGNFHLTYDTTSLSNGGIVTITGYIDSIGIGAAIHNDYVVDNICVENDPLGLNEEFSSTFSIYPNPTEGSIFLSIKEGSTTSISIRNSVGQLLLSDILSSGQIEIDLSMYSAGLYFINIEVDNQFMTQKVFKK
jgi:hypothetical protein